MTLKDLFARIVPVLEATYVPYMLTGSVVSSLYGTPRSTLDLDVVIAPTREQLLDLVRRLAKMDYYADEQQALEALSHRSQFNVIDDVTSWKVDFIFREDTEYGRVAFDRRSTALVADRHVQISSAEDILLAKLRWMKTSGSDRQMRDAIGILSTQGAGLDVKYLERWVGELQLKQEWKTLTQQS